MVAIEPRFSFRSIEEADLGTIVCLDTPEGPRWGIAIQSMHTRPDVLLIDRLKDTDAHPVRSSAIGEKLLVLPNAAVEVDLTSLRQSIDFGSDLGAIAVAENGKMVLSFVLGKVDRSVRLNWTEAIGAIARPARLPSLAGQLAFGSQTADGPHSIRLAFRLSVLREGESK